MMKIITPEVLA